MSRHRFAATRLSPAQAHEVWSRSDEATAFTRPDYLAQLVDEVEWWGVERSGEAVAAWPLVRAVAGGPIAPPPFCYYVGPMFARELRYAKKHRSWTIRTAIFSTLIDAVVADNDRFQSSLPLGLSDVRPLLWWNFDNLPGAGFTLTARYTARIDLAGYPDEASLGSSLARVKRRDIRRWSAAPPIRTEDVPEQRIIELHDQTLARTGAACDEDRRRALKRVIDLIRHGAGAIIGFSHEDMDQVQAVILLLDGPDESNDVLCVASDTGRESGLLAWATWQGLLRAQSIGKRWFDFNGANSPGRAADKHFYGATEQLYFDCRFERHPA